MKAIVPISNLPASSNIFTALLKTCNPSHGKYDNRAVGSYKFRIFITFLQLLHRTNTPLNYYPTPLWARTLSQLHMLYSKLLRKSKTLLALPYKLITLALLLRMQL